MDSEINHLNQLLEEENSYNLASIGNTPNLGRLPFDARNQESLFSPANNFIRNRIFPFRSPSPIRAHQYYYEDDNSLSPESANLRHQISNNNKIDKVIHFEQTPKFKAISSEPSTILRAPKYYDEPNPSHILTKGRKNSKGLRNLSKSVYKIVLNHKVTTYKEVAEQLVEMLNNGEFGQLRQSKDRNKDEQNIKRRVYDALNVLISADVLKKNGKYVISDDQVLSQKLKFPNKLPNTKQSPSDLLDQINKKKSELAYKKQILAELKNKQQTLQAVLKRNQNRSQTQQKISFPLIGVVHENLKKQPVIIFKNSRSSVRIWNLGKIDKIIGDLDLMLKIGIKKEVGERMEVKEDACKEKAVVGRKEEMIKNEQEKVGEPEKKKKPQRKLLYSL